MVYLNNEQYLFYFFFVFWAKTDSWYKMFPLWTHPQRSEVEYLHAGNKCVYVPVCYEYFVMLSLTTAATVRQREFIKDGLLITCCAMKYLRLSYLSPTNLTVFTLWDLSRTILWLIYFSDLL